MLAGREHANPAQRPPPKKPPQLWFRQETGDRTGSAVRDGTKAGEVLRYWLPRGGAGETADFVADQSWRPVDFSGKNPIFVRVGRQFISAWRAHRFLNGNVVAIPRKIHQYFHDRNVVPAVFNDHLDTIRRVNSGWAYRLYDDIDARAYIQDKYGGEILKAYDRINPGYRAARSDFFRYLLLYQEGGIYLDMKSNATLPLDAVISPDDEYLLSHWRNAPGQKYAGFGLHPSFGISGRGEFQQWHIIASPRHRFLAAVIEVVLGNIRKYSVASSGVGPYVLAVTGPIAYTTGIRKAMTACSKYRLVDIEDLGFEYSVFLGAGAVLGHRRFYPSNYRTMTEPIVLDGADPARVGFDG